jgi:DNA-binding transcriptional LysR family regulator
MDIDNIKAFLAVAEHRSFSRAADALFLTQPAVSKRIASLEDTLGSRLFDRIGREIKLTHAGATLLPHAHNILAGINAGSVAVQNLSDEVSGTLSIGISHHISLRRIPPILREFIVKYPEVQFDIHFMDSEEGYRAVEQGKLELAIVTLPGESPPELEMTTIWNDPLAIVTSAVHELCKSPAPNLDSLLEHPAILPAQEDFTRQRIEEAIHQRGGRIEIGLETNNLETIRMMVSIGLGWTVLPHTMIDDSLSTHEIDGISISRALGTIVDPRRTLTNAARAMIDMLTSVE